MRRISAFLRTVLNHWECDGYGINHEEVRPHRKLLYRVLDLKQEVYVALFLQASYVFVYSKFDYPAGAICIIIRNEA